jgi:hypothetical protein
MGWLLLFALPGIGQPLATTLPYTDHFELLVPSPDLEIKSQLLQLCESLNSKKHRYKNQTSFWRHVYYKVHRKYLRNYQSPATLNEVLKNGTYDCLAGTALYALIFDQLGADYRIVETSYHIYLELTVNGKVILVESTNPLGGFVTDEILVENLKQDYLNNTESNGWGNKDFYRSQPVFNKSISLKELAGLQYFNLAVEAYNNRDLPNALALQDRALRLYPSIRLEEMMAVMLKTMESDPTFDLVLKQQYLSKYDHLRHTIVVAFQK